MTSYVAALCVEFCPVACGALLSFAAAATAPRQEYANASPQPTSPSSVSTRTRQKSSFLRAPAPWLNGMASGTASRRAIFIAPPPFASQERALGPSCEPLRADSLLPAGQERRGFCAVGPGR